MTLTNRWDGLVSAGIGSHNPIKARMDQQGQDATDHDA